MKKGQQVKVIAAEPNKRFGQVGTLTEIKENPLGGLDYMVKFLDISYSELFFEEELEVVEAHLKDALHVFAELQPDVQRILLSWVTGKQEMGQLVITETKEMAVLESVKILKKNHIKLILTNRNAYYDERGDTEKTVLYAFRFRG